MSHSLRLTIFLIGAVGLALIWGAAFTHLPGPRDLRDRYLLQLDSRTFPERNVTDIVTAVNFDYRGFDTVGEEFILFASVIGSLILLRQASEKRTHSYLDAISSERDVGPSDAMRLWILALVGPKIAFGIYIVLHGQLSPGGGFQGGVILASAALIIYLGHNFETFKRIMMHPLVEIAEAAGAAAFVLTGFLAFFYRQPFLTNVIPLGKARELTSGGTIAIISAATGIEVMGGFVLLLYAFLQETLIAEKGK
jgi:multicomponent Na+:H+ antiporter subunit B